MFVKLADLLHFIEKCSDSILFKCDNESSMQLCYQFEIDINAAKLAQAKTSYGLASLHYNLCEYKQKVFFKRPNKCCKVHVIVR